MSEDRYAIGRKFSEGFVAAVKPEGCPEDSSPHFVAGYEAGYAFRAEKNRLLNEYMVSIGRKPFGVVRLADTSPTQPIEK